MASFLPQDLRTAKRRGCKARTKLSFRKKVTEMDTPLKPAPKPAMSKQPENGLVQAFTTAFTTDDVQSVSPVVTITHSQSGPMGLSKPISPRLSDETLLGIHAYGNRRL